MKPCYLVVWGWKISQAMWVPEPKVKEWFYLIWALRRILEGENFIAWGFLAGVGVLEGCWISNTAVTVLYRG